MSNRLNSQSSPYLLQHAQNPVDWFPWCKEAFEKAASEDKPVFLSIGYSTCHWCHVMAHESFENKEIAEILNKHFISIKVDREERPDIDSVYMAVCQAFTGSGGWPMSIFTAAAIHVLPAVFWTITPVKRWLFYPYMQQPEPLSIWNTHKLSAGKQSASSRTRQADIFCMEQRTIR